MEKSTIHIIAKLIAKIKAQDENSGSELCPKCGDIIQWHKSLHSGHTRARCGGCNLGWQE